MNGNETRLIEAGWAVLVEQLGLTEATRFIMLLDRRTGGGLQHIQRNWPDTRTTTAHKRYERLYRDQEHEQSKEEAA